MAHYRHIGVLGYPWKVQQQYTIEISDTYDQTCPRATMGAKLPPIALLYGERIRLRVLMSTFGSPLKKPTGRDSLLGSSHRDSKNSAGDRVLAPFRSPDQLAGEADPPWDRIPPQRVSDSVFLSDRTEPAMMVGR